MSRTDPLLKKGLVALTDIICLPVVDVCSSTRVGFELKSVPSPLLDTKCLYSIPSGVRRVWQQTDVRSFACLDADALPDNLTRALVLNPITAAISAVAIVLDLGSFCTAAPVLLVVGSTITVLAAVFALAAFVICMVLFPLASKRFVDEGATEASLGSANWLVSLEEEPYQ